MQATMNLNGFYGKTDKGRDEVAKRCHGLPQALRAVLILLDGKTSLRELTNRCKSIPNFADDVQLLIEDGFIGEVRGSAPPASLSGSPGSDAQPTSTGGKRAQLIGIANRVLGPHAAAVVARLQKCGDGPSELTASLDSCYKLIKLTIDEGKAEEFRLRGRWLLEGKD